MQGYQSLTTALSSGYYGDTLIPCPQGADRTGPALSLQRNKGRGLDPSLRVPVSPGHVRPLYPYPPSRRRRR